MKKVMVFVAVLTMVAFAFGALAAEKTTTTPAKTTPAPKIEKFSGAIAAVNALAKTFDVKEMGKAVNEEEKVMSFVTTDKTKITEWKWVKAFADLQWKMVVTVEYKVEGGKNMAEAVKITWPRPARPLWPEPKK